MNPKVMLGLKYWWGIVAGGIGGALTSYFQQVGIQINFSQLDWHKIGQVAATGAVTALALHLAPSPIQKSVPAADTPSPTQAATPSEKGQTNG